MAVAAAAASCERVEEDFEAKAKRAEEILACPNCKQVRELVLLSPCGHSYCEECLKQYKKDQECMQVSKLHCPVCGKKVETESENKDANEMKQLLEREKEHRKNIEKVGPTQIKLGKLKREQQRVRKKSKQVCRRLMREDRKTRQLERNQTQLLKRNKALARKVKLDKQQQKTLGEVDELLKNSHPINPEVNVEAAEQARRSFEATKRVAEVLLETLAASVDTLGRELGYEPKMPRPQQVPQQAAQAPQPQQYQIPQPQQQQAQVPWAAPAPAQPAPASVPWVPFPYPQMQGCTGNVLNLIIGGQNQHQ